MAKKEIKKIVDKRIHDHFVKLKKVKQCYLIILSSMPNTSEKKIKIINNATWFIDIMDNGKDNSPRCNYLFIGTKNHYAVAYPLNSKSALAIRQTSTRFINENHPIKLTIFEEADFVEKNNVRLLCDNHYVLQIINEQNHSSLGIIDRMKRAFKGYEYIPTIKSFRQSNSNKYRPFSENV